MYEFLYDYIKPKYGNKANLLFMDTDSFLLEIEKEDHTGDVYQDMIEDSEWYDFSEYPPDCPQFKNLTKEHIEDLQTKNKKVVGKMKDETNSRPITGFSGLRPKSYALQIEGKVKENVVESLEIQEKQADKGVKEIIKKKYLTFDKHVEALALTAGYYAEKHSYMDPKDTALLQKIKEGKKRKIVIRQNIISSQQHTLKTITMEKSALSGFDIKRLIMSDNIHTLPHGHYKYRQYPQELQDIDWNEDMEILQQNDIDWGEDMDILDNDTITNKKNESVYEDIDWNENILPTENNNNNNKEEETEKTIKSLCTDIDWDDISIVNEKNISTPQMTGEEEQLMVDVYIRDLKLGPTQENKVEKEPQNIEERAEIYNLFEENNVNSYDMEAGWEIQAFSGPQ